MRNKSENEMRDRYVRQYASVLAVEALIQHRAKTADIVLTIEAEDVSDWDDIVQVHKSSGKIHRHQVKRQQTPLPYAEFGRYFAVAIEQPEDVEFHFAFPSLVDIEEVENIRFLRTMCGRISQDGANPVKVIESLQAGEKAWLKATQEWTKLAEEEALLLLKRVHIDIIGYEEDLDNRALRLLEPVFGNATEEAWSLVQVLMSDKDGVVEIDPSFVLSTLPPPAADDIETFYWSFVEEVETCFEVRAWTWLTDSLVRNLVPEEFERKVFGFSLSVQRTAWPGRHLELEQALINLSNRAVDFLTHFETRSTIHGEWIRYDHSLDSHETGWFAEGTSEFEKWDNGNVPRLINMVVGLNDLFKSVRKCLRQTYRMRDGKLGIHDMQGFRNNTEGVISYWDNYVEIK